MCGSAVDLRLRLWHFGIDSRVDTIYYAYKLRKSLQVIMVVPANNKFIDYV
jgi:hypothetical protein